MYHATFAYSSKINRYEGISMGWLTILPQVVAIGVVIWRKEVILALLAGIFTAEFLLLFDAANTTAALAPIETIERIVSVFESPGNTKVLMFSLIIGCLIAYMRHSGGVTALVEFMINRGVTKTKKQAGLLTFFTGIVLFVESNLSVITAGILSRGIFDKFGMSRERLAYVIDSTSAPVCILLLLNGWGAVALANMQQSGLENAESALVGSIFYNFYAWIALIIVLFTILTDKIHGPLKEYEKAMQKKIEDQQAPEFEGTKARFMVVPLISLISLIFVFMYWTGDGVIREGDGSSSILYATIISCMVAYIMMLSSKMFSHVKLVDIGFKGMNELLPLVTIVLLSLALGASLRDLGTGAFVAGLASDTLPLILIVPMLFLASSLMAFSTGTSWGTFALMIPIAVPLIQMLGLPPAFVISAVLGGGVFGDHCSPISDTTVISSVASGCDLLDHVKTQLPYALIGGVLAFITYFLVGLVII
ncbi:Na+/H+ antiporter NhaC family protein [Pseudemcibacter aquimaris]|uniref:Na+/H+ antiporter NhaC family protein n=1 Tax=Pseudemcibacter aquimaris TaxID=2857064 RepID=UPI00237D4CFC|nr:Na+/H+ antiporter NhaC family protein [Pseudemcibacter aquimaris]